jgi:hypothetical protein
MGEQRVTIGVMAAPGLKESLERQAKSEGRTLSNLAERLLAWSYEQLVEAGDSNTLTNWEAAPRKGRIKKRGVA